MNQFALSSVPRGNKVRLWLSVIAYNLGNPWRRFSVAEEDRELVADQLAAAAGEDGRPAGETCALLLARTTTPKRPGRIAVDTTGQEG